MVARVLFFVLLSLNIGLLWWFMRRFLSTGRANVLERAFLVVLALFLWLCWWGLVFAEIGKFSLFSLDLILILSALVMLLLWGHSRKLVYNSIPIHLDKYDFATLLLLVAFGVLYASPAEWIIGGLDPGTYVNTGVSIAKTGSLIIQNDVLNDVPESQRSLLLYGIRHANFHVKDRVQSTFTPPFFHGLPVWIGILYVLGGLRLALFATPILGWLSLLAVYLLGRRLIHPGAGVLAMVLVGVNISQLWFSRNQFADSMLQFLLSSGFLVFSIYQEALRLKHKPFVIPLAVLSAACFGFAHLTKLDVFVIPPVILIFVVYIWLVGIFDQSYLWFIVLYIFSLIHTALHAYYFSLNYVMKAVNAILDDYSKAFVWMLVFGVLVFLFIVWQRVWVSRMIEKILACYEILVRIAAVLVLLLSFYAYFIRPFRADLGALQTTGLSNKGEVINKLQFIALQPRFASEGGWDGVRTYEEEDIVRVGWFLTPVGVWLAIVGFVYWFTASKKPEALFFLGALFGNAVLLFYRGTLLPYFFWRIRRYVPIVIPGMLLCVTYLIWKLWSSRKDDWRKLILPICLSGFLFVSYVFGGLMFWRHVQYQGVIEKLSAWAETLPEDGVFLSDPSLHSALGTPLFHIYNRTFFPVVDRAAVNPELRVLIAQWLQADRPVYWLSRNCEFVPDYAPLWLDQERTLTWPYVPPTVETLPDHIAEFVLDFCVYRIGSASEKHSVPQNLEVGFDQSVSLLGFESSGDRVLPGGKVHLNLYWQATRPLPVDYKVFVHLVADNGQIAAQHDHTPVEGARPTSSWSVGETVLDSVTLHLPVDIQEGEYELRVGLYDFDTLERLSVFVEGEAITSTYVVLQTIEVIIPSKTK